MIRHVVMFRWKDGTDHDDVAAMESGLRSMPGLIPQIQEYRFGADLGINDANWDFVVVADFASTNDYVDYRDDAHHQALIKETIAPHIEERATVQYELD
jgi:Stress responsive A/B Barrel Domain